MFHGKIWGLTLASIATASWGSFYIVARYIFGESENPVDPIFFSFLRFVMASAFFMAVIPLKGLSGDTVKAFKESWKLFLFLALSGIVLEGVLVFWSTKYTTAARSSLFANLSPIFTVIMAVAASREKLDWRKGVGMCVGFAGAAMAISSQSKGDIYFSCVSALGDLLAAGSGVCWAAYTVWGGDVSKRYGSLIGTAVPMFAGTVMLLILTIATGRVGSLALPLKIWLAIAYLGVVGNGVAYLCWYAALKYLKAGEVGAFGYISAAIAATMSFFMLKESFSIWFFLSLGCVVAGVYLMMEREKPVENASGLANACE